MKKNTSITYRFGKKAIFSFESSVAKATRVNNNSDTATIGTKVYIPFGDGDDHPTLIRDNYIEKYTVLAASIKYKSTLIVGQGVYPAKIIGYKENGTEILQPVNDPEILSFLNGRIFNSYLKKAAHNLTAYGNLYPELVLSINKNKIVRIFEKSAINSRWGVNNDSEKLIDSLLLMPDWTEQDEANLKTIQTLDFDEPLLDLEEKKQSLESAVYVNSTYDFKYYNIPAYETAIQSKWVDLALKTPLFLNAAYDNALNILYHIKIPQAYIDEHFPLSNFKTNNEQLDAINSFLDSLEENLTTAESARKTITNISVDGDDGKPIYWEITEIKDSSSFTKEILAHDTADNQLTNTFLINDAVFIKKSSGGGSGSGSDIREAHLINVGMLKPERDAIMEPIEIIRDFNNWGEDIVFRFRDSILTTLDTNAGTTSVVS